MKKRILVLGGGFGGLSAVLRLDYLIKRHGLGEEVEVKIIDKNEYHTFTPLLYEMATVIDDMSDKELRSLVSYPFEELLGRTSAEYVKGEAENIDFKKRNVVLKNGDGIAFDYLVLSPGSEAAFYGMEGIKDHGFSLKTMNDALEIRDELKKKLGKKKIKVIVGGGGYTGVELAGEIKVMAERAEGENVEVTIVEGNGSILHGLNEKVIKKAERRLDMIGVKMETGSLISDVKKDKVVLKNGKELSFDVFLWSGGIKASSMSEKMEFEKKGSGKMAVSETLEVKDGKEFENVYSVGDFSYFENPETGVPEPAVARVAINGGRVAAENVILKITGKDEKKKYECRDLPYVIPIGGKYAIAKFGPFVFSGFLAWIVKGLVELNYFISILPFPRALEVWFRGLRVFIKNDRLG